MAKPRNRRQMHQAKYAGQAAPSVHPKSAVRDSFANFAARVGIGTNNQASAGHYQLDFISRNRQQLEAAYRSSWIVGVAVDAVAEDMTSEGVEILSTMAPEDIDKLNKAMTRLAIWSHLCDTIKWSRLYGGCLAYMMIDGQNASTPLNLDTIGKGQFKGLLVLDRWLVQPSLHDLVTELGPDIGKPKYYEVVADAQALTRQKIHYSRVIRLDGVDLPYWQRIAENGWGQSVIERLWDRLLPYDSTTEGAAQLVYKAHLRTYKVKGLRDIIANGGKSFEGLTKQIEFIRQYQSNEGMTLMDGEDEFEAHQYTFAGLSDMMLQFAQQLSGALQIPLVRLLGQSPAGLNSTGEADLRTYYDGIKKLQNRHLRAPFGRLLDVLHRSEFGKPLPEDTNFEFASLWQMSDKEKAEINSSVTTAVKEAEENGLIDRKTALQELRQSSRITGIWTNITDEMIEEAENDPPKPSEIEMVPTDVQNPNDRQENETRSDPGAQG